jgi:phosphate:Na+ symporter
MCSPDWASCSSASTTCKEGFEAFRDTINLTEFAMPGFAGLIVFSLIGLAATVIMQSSHATLVLIITALAAQQITYENALALAIGANIGTTITAIIGAMSSNYQGKRLAAAHLIFNVITGAIAIAFISQLMWAVDSISQTVGIRNDDFTLKLAVFHTIFNFIGVAVMLPFVPKLVAFLQRLIPKPRTDVTEPKFINEAAFDFPEPLIHSVRQEALHLYELAADIIAKGLNLDVGDIHSQVELEDYVENRLKKVEIDVRDEYTRKVKPLSGSILDFISKAHNSLEPEFGNRLFELREACHSIVLAVKAVGHLRKNIVAYCASDNDDIRREYNAIRLQVANLMREIHDLEQSGQQEDANVDVLSLDVHKVTIKEGNPVADGSIDAMLHQEKITPSMGTSLVNDLDYAEKLIWNLADMGKIVFGAEDQATREVEDMLALTEEDMEDDETVDQAA